MNIQLSTRNATMSICHIGFLDKYFGEEYFDRKKH